MKQGHNHASTGEAGWKHQSERSSMFWLRIMTWISLTLGRRPARIVLKGIALYFVAFAPHARRMSRNYLRRALKLARPEDVRWSQLFRHFLSFASAIHDRVYLLNDRFDLFDIKIHNQALISNAIKEGKGVFLIGAHLGSFEVLRAIGRRQPGLRVAMVMYEENARKINAALHAINPNSTQDIIPLGHIDSMIQVHELLECGTVVGMLGDRSLDNDETSAAMFLGDSAEFPLGPFRMAAILKRPVIFMAGIYRGGNRYEVHFEELADFSVLPLRGRTHAVRAAVTRFAALVENHCLDAPYNWYNFFDFWRPSAKRPSAQHAPANSNAFHAHDASL
jgi:predicted LPLAT superfamily acyltransferase